MSSVNAPQMNQVAPTKAGAAQKPNFYIDEFIDPAALVNFSDVVAKIREYTDIFLVFLLGGI